MKFYNRQHEFYCGIDLPANSMHVCVIDQAGDKHLHRNFNTKQPDRFLIALQPFHQLGNRGQRTVHSRSRSTFDHG